MEWGTLEQKSPIFVLKGVRMGYLRTKIADFVLTMAKGPFTLFSPSPLKRVRCKSMCLGLDIRDTGSGAKVCVSINK